MTRATCLPYSTSWWGPRFPSSSPRRTPASAASCRHGTRASPLNSHLRWVVQLQHTFYRKHSDQKMSYVIIHIWHNMCIAYLSQFQKRIIWWWKCTNVWEYNNALQLIIVCSVIVLHRYEFRTADCIIDCMHNNHRFQYLQWVTNKTKLMRQKTNYSQNSNLPCVDFQELWQFKIWVTSFVPAKVRLKLIFSSPCLL